MKRCFFSHRYVIESVKLVKGWSSALRIEEHCWKCGDVRTTEKHTSNLEQKLINEVRNAVYAKAERSPDFKACSEGKK